MNQEPVTDVLLSIRNLAVHFDTEDGMVEALDGVNLDLMRGEYHWHLLMTGSVLLVLPIVMLFLAGQRHFIEGARVGAVKG